MLLFVYGTLMRGMRNHGVLGAARARLIGEAVTEPGYRLFEVRGAGFPALVRDGTGTVRGELWDLEPDRIVGLDRFEGCPHIYERKLVCLESGQAVFAYFWARDRNALVPVPSGSWREHLAPARPRPAAARS